MALHRHVELPPFVNFALHCTAHTQLECERRVVPVRTSPPLRLRRSSAESDEVRGSRVTRFRRGGEDEPASRSGLRVRNEARYETAPGAAQRSPRPKATPPRLAEVTLLLACTAVKHAASKRRQCRYTIVPDG